eukprot:GHVT01049618.1.p4 GENE.GHVT01049618.1~~GHVT01049618.1.p4  ORF type:complete len:124 (+),score=36.09 GHVT01049618.1:426-797(+)
MAVGAAGAVAAAPAAATVAAATAVAVAAAVAVATAVAGGGGGAAAAVAATGIVFSVSISPLSNARAKCFAAPKVPTVRHEGDLAQVAITKALPPHGVSRKPYMDEKFSLNAEGKNGVFFIRKI